MGEFMNIVSDEITGFEFFLTQKTKNNFSNFPEDNLNHLLSLRKITKKKNVQAPPKKLKFDFNPTNTEFFDIAEMIKFILPNNVCNMTLDELLDKIGKDGIGSLSEQERNKLDEYSKSLN
jgi:hypothetical protein